METPLREFLETAADVAVGVRSRVVTAQVEQPIVLILNVVTTAVEHNAGGLVAAVIGNISRCTTTNGRRI